MIRKEGRSAAPYEGMGPFQRFPQRFRLWDSRRRRQWGRRPAGRFAEVTDNVSRVDREKFGLDHGGKIRLGVGRRVPDQGRNISDMEIGDWPL